MSEAGSPDLPALLARLRLTSDERRFFLRTDTEATLAKVRTLTAAALYLNGSAVALYGGRHGSTRGIELIEQVIGAAFQTFGSADPHPEAFDKAAMLLRGITAGHPFQDGNKRTGFLVATYYLEAVGHPLPPAVPVEEAVDLCWRVSKGELRNVSAIARALERLWEG